MDNREWEMKRTKWEPSKSQEFRRALRAHARKRSREIEDEAGWLDKVPDFNQNLRLPDRFNPMVQMLFERLDLQGRYTDQKRIDLEVLIANLILVRSPVKISYKRSNWNTWYHRASYGTITIIEKMEAEGLLQMRKGYTDEQGNARRTRIWITLKLLEECPELHPDVIWEPVRLVELKDENGNLVTYKPNAESNRVEKILRKAKEVNDAAEIRFESFKINGTLIAVYIKDFQHYGRLHTRGYRHYQGMNSKTERPYITINGNPTIELDYSALHPYLLYAKEGIQYEGDPYAAVNSDPELRDIYKTAFVAMINAPFNLAQKAINKKILDEYHIWGRRGVKKARPVMDDILREHQPIAKYLCSEDGFGLRLMNKDAKIALNVIRRFVMKGIPILAVHDSFIVEEQHADLLTDVMKQAYRENTKGMEINLK